MSIRTPILGLHILTPAVFKDFRGQYVEVFNHDNLKAEYGLLLPLFSFIQDDMIRSYKNVLRGYHGDDRTWKYIMCLQGAFAITVLDIDPESETFMQHDQLILDEHEYRCLLVPPRYVVAHLCLTDTCLFYYKQTTNYLGERYQYSIRWDSVPDVYWGQVQPILSERDADRANEVTDYIDRNTGKLLSPDQVNV